MTDKSTMTTILEPLLAYLREGNNQTRINEVLTALASLGGSIGSSCLLRPFPTIVTSKLVPNG